MYSVQNMSEKEERVVNWHINLLGMSEFQKRTTAIEGKLISMFFF